LAPEIEGAALSLEHFGNQQFAGYLRKVLALLADQQEG
jgi:hypothetical protein